MKIILNQFTGRIKSALTIKSRVKNPRYLLLIASLGLMLADRATAQTFTTLHSFTAALSPNFTNSDGATPYYAGLVLSGNTLYGTTALGGTNANGALFAVNVNFNGTFTTLHSFTSTPGSNFTNSDGAYPNAGLILSGNTLYGTAYAGGTNGTGTVFAINTNGTGFTTLYNFTALVAGTNGDGANPICNLIISSNILYGTTSDGGTNGTGTVFAIYTNGTGFTVLHTFSAASLDLSGYYTNSDGTGPNTLILSGNVLYGTAYSGGTNGMGTVFAVNTDGAGFATLHNFSALIAGTNSDGAEPYSGIILSGNTLYGTAAWGGTNDEGTVFGINTNGTGLTIVHTFMATLGSDSTNADGANPEAELFLSGGTLYGTATYGGTNGNGTVFAVSTNGTGFSTLYSFTATSGPDFTNSDGSEPNAGLMLSGNTLYGTASSGGLTGNGTVFALSFPSPQLTITLSGTNADVMWPISVAGFSYSGYSLQFTTNLASPDWTAMPSAPVVVNGQNAVTNAVSGPQQFFRLSQ